MAKQLDWACVLEDLAAPSSDVVFQGIAAHMHLPVLMQNAESLQNRLASRKQATNETPSPVDAKGQVIANHTAQ